MKKIVRIILALSICTFFLSALEYPGTATGDDFLSLRVNPAAMAFGNAGGIAYIQPYLLDSQYGPQPELFRDFSLQFAATHLGYYFDKNDTSFTHNVLGAFPLFPNFFFGIKGSWDDSAIGDATGTVGVLARPADFISLAATAENVMTGNASGRLGLGIRPFPFNTSNPALLTLGTDIPWDSGLRRPVLHASSEPVEGINLFIAYNMETETVSGGISYSVGIGRAGTLVDEDTNGAAFVHLGTKNYTTPTLPMTDPYIRFQPGPKIVEERGGGFALFAPPKPTLFEVLKEIDRLKKDSSVKGILIEKENFELSWAGYLELINALNSFRKAGKKVIYYYENISLWNYVLAASTADAIYLNRMGTVDLTGIGSTRLYFGGLLENFGIKVHNIRSHPYKNGANNVSEKGMTPEEREMMDYFYRGISDEVLKLIRTGRGDKLSGTVEELAAAGPYLISSDAEAAGLVDGIIFEDEIEQKLLSFDNKPVITDGNFLEPFRNDWSDPYSRQIALIYAVGMIVPGPGVPGKTIGSETLNESIRAARQNPFVRAVLLRIDSGGGSSLASDLIAREIKLTVDSGKPVVVSIAGTGASGGYYIAAYANKIIASPVSITGSIGVYAALPEFAGLLDKYGVGADSVGTEPNARFGNPFTRMSETEQKKLRDSIDRIYKMFVDVVAEGRGMDPADVDAVAQGRVWTGRQALERGLIDQLGDFNDALAVAVKEAGIKGQYMLVDYSNRDIPLSMRMAETFSAPIQAALPLSEVMDQARFLSLAENEACLFLMPFDPGE